MKAAIQKVSSTDAPVLSEIYPDIAQRTICDGNVVLYLRERSRQWQAYIRRSSGKWLSVSTRKSDLQEAKDEAKRIYEKMLENKATAQVDLPKQFRSVAKLTVKEIQSELDSGQGKACFQNYIWAIEKYLVPALGDDLVHEIGIAQLKKLDNYRLKVLGHKPVRSTVATHNTALYRVFQTAVAKGYMLQTQVPRLQNKGTKATARPYFDETEMAYLTKCLDDFTTVGKKKSTKAIRLVLRDYALILANTGMRPGRESLKLKWCHLRKLALPGTSDTGLEFSVDGKTGKRSLIAKDTDGVVSACLRRLASRDPTLTSLSDSELFKQDAYVFQYKGKAVKTGRMADNFTECLALYGLTKNPQGEERTLYSLRHSYATFQILNGVDMATLAVQMGTSIAMLERHYSKLKPYMKLKVLNGSATTNTASNSLESVVVRQQETIERLMKLLEARTN